MKKYNFILGVLLFILTHTANAQYVTIPDANFAAYLTATIPAAMSGNQMDTTNPAVAALTRIDIENMGILDITGVQYFRNLLVLDCGNGTPSIDSNHITSLPVPLASTLDTLICGNNQITSLPALPTGLICLKCYLNKLTSLPTLPTTLTYLNCDNNQLSAIPTLPGTLIVLATDGNAALSNLPALPSLLADLSCQYDDLSSLPSLPASLTDLSCDNNPIINLPTLPVGLMFLSCSNNQLTSLPTLPTYLQTLTCNNNQLTSLPALPGRLGGLDCNSNQLTSLPALPAGLQTLSCYSNQLTSLPTLPGTLQVLWCANNNIACFPEFPNSITDSSYFEITSNPFTCIPNYIHNMPKAITEYPLCAPGNPNGCSAAYGIIGYTYRDMNSNCIRDNGDNNLTNIPVQVYDNSNNFLGETYTAISGVYDFLDTGATYKVVVDTTGMPYQVQCTYPGADSILNINAIDTNINFSLTCKAGFDVGVQSVATMGLIFPGMQHDLSVVAGDMSQWYNLDCANGDSGTVQITISGPVTYVGPGVGALTPVVTGNVYTYQIPNYGAINNTKAFNLLLKTDTNAKAGDTICVYVTVTPLADNNPINNTYQYCYYVINSHDPNSKDVFPVNVPPGYNNWFTYTIHFQNTGNAAANNILVVDTLDPNLDLTTFQLINYSYGNTVSLSSTGVLNVRFSGINLPDSTVNPIGSTGFVQYRIKPKANLPDGTTMKNTGYIYFDYNGAVVTNTTQNLFSDSVAGVNSIAANISCKVFPNPSNGIFTIAINQPGTISGTQTMVEIYNVLGEKIYDMPLQQAKGNNIINISDKPAGVYFYRIIAGNGDLISDGKMIVE